MDVAHFGGPPSRAAAARSAAAGGRGSGYYGVIDERIDCDLLAASPRPGRMEFVMVGPVVKVDPAELPRQPNIHWLGQRPYAELPAYLEGVGRVP